MRNTRYHYRMRIAELQDSVAWAVATFGLESMQFERYSLILHRTRRLQNKELRRAMHRKPRRVNGPRWFFYRPMPWALYASMYLHEVN